MVRKLKIENGIAKFDTPYFIFSKNEDLEIELDLGKDTRYGLYKLAVKGTTYSAKKGKTIKVPLAKFELEQRITFNLALCDINDTKVVQSYIVEPLEIVSVGENFEAVAVIQNLVETVNMLHGKLKALEERFHEYETGGFEIEIDEQAVETPTTAESTEVDKLGEEK